jgi:acyl-CoA reductase-like NAD-dependent aldehyde dehydrogenase
MSAIECAHLIGGQRVGQPRVARANPADPGDVVSVRPEGEQAHAEAAVSAAAQAQAAWATTPAPARGAVLSRASQLLRERADQVALDLCREEGKTLAEARGEVSRAVDVLAYFGGEGWRLFGQVVPSSEPDMLLYTRREPLGVVACITPWNFPIAIPAWKIAPALVAGNTVVLKPASLIPLTAYHLVGALQDAGLPAGVLNLLYGGSALGDALVADPRVAGISFTGSTAVGTHIHAVASARRARVQLEMGGKNPLVVLDDADPEFAASIAATGGFGLTGQACTATSRVICTPGIYDRLLAALVAQAARYQPGDGRTAGVLMGPVVSQDQLARDREAVERASADGARTVAGGSTIDGLLFEPTVIERVRREQSLWCDEVFGPVIAVMRADDPAHAFTLANDTAYGLCAGIVTNDLALASRFVERVQAGVVKVNRPTTGLELSAPFGGMKDSSTNTFREQGWVATEFFSTSKTVYLGW